MDRQIFLDIYASFFPKLGANDGLSEWVSFADSAMEADFRVAMDGLDEVWRIEGRMGKPKLGHVKRAYFEVRKGNGCFVRDCGYCHGNGLVWFLVAFWGGKKHVVNPHDGLPEDRRNRSVIDSLGASTAPCVCAGGRFNMGDWVGPVREMGVGGEFVFSGAGDRAKGRVIELKRFYLGVGDEKA